MKISRLKIVKIRPVKGKALRKHSLHGEKQPRFYRSCSSVVIKDSILMTPPSACSKSGREQTFIVIHKKIVNIVVKS